MIWGLCRACIKQQCLCLPWQEKELCSLRSWRWTLILTVTEPANTIPPFLMMSSAPYFWMKQITAMWHALSNHRRHDSINFLPKICLTAGFIFQFYELLVQLFSYTDHQGKKIVSEEYAYIIYCIDNPFVCIVLVLLCSFCKSLVCVDKVSCLLNIGDLRVGLVFQVAWLLACWKTLHKFLVATLKL